MYKHAKREIEVLQRVQENPVLNPYEDIIYAFVKKYEKQKYVPRVKDQVNQALLTALRLCLEMKPIYPLLGGDDEWEEVNIDDTVMIQNKRFRSIFKDDAGPYFLDGIIWTEGENAWNGEAWHNGLKYTSKRKIKFPFAPMTFYVEIEREEIAKDDWKFNVVDESTFLQAVDYFKTAIKL